MVDELKNAMEFMRVIGMDENQETKSVDLFMSHEGLLLDYETALTRKVFFFHERWSSKELRSITIFQVIIYGLVIARVSWTEDMLNTLGAYRIRLVLRWAHRWNVMNWCVSWIYSMRGLKMGK
jgi:hypothetical protein